MGTASTWSTTRWAETCSTARAAARRGTRRILVIGFASGRVPDIPANHVLVKNYSVVGVHFGGAVARDVTLLPRVASALAQLHADGAIDPLVFAEIPFADVPDALALLGARGTTGKVVVSVG